MSEYYSQVPTKEGYRFNLEEPNGSKREEMGIIMNPGQPDEHLVVMGSYSTYDDKTDTETITMYTADKDGYKSRYMIKNRKLSPGALKSAAG
ncbi:GH16751 [Drosophila grimshawi]|uniref:GH16751 n=2 Tax=Drosophila grimshawi TaxID=7222 RepID=B4JU27_DROGR|nr:GH16751 [Drosophila grimshawi]